MPFTVATTILYLVFSFGFVLSLYLPANPLYIFLKITPFLFIFPALISELNGKRLWYLMVAVLFSMAGDIFLEFKFNGAFILGLLCFLVSHLFYIARGLLDYNKLSQTIIYKLLILSPAPILAFFIIPGLNDMLLPVLAYMVAITINAFICSNQRSRWLGVGAFIFILSDGMIAYNKFITPVEGIRFPIMITYYAAQYLLIGGYLKTKP
jgi:uncharacterized membrane protein YhhN